MRSACRNCDPKRFCFWVVFISLAGSLAGQQTKAHTIWELQSRLDQIEAKAHRLSGKPYVEPVRPLPPEPSSPSSETVPSGKELTLAPAPSSPSSETFSSDKELALAPAHPILLEPAPPVATPEPPAAPRKKESHHGFRIAPRASTLGAGLEMAKGFSPRFGTRLGFNYFGYDYSAEASGIDYNVDLGLRSVALLADLHPFKGMFRISGGVVLNGNRLKMLADLDPSAPEDINGVSYALDSVKGTLKFNNLAPYLGLGWDTTFGEEDHWGLTFDVGVIYSGSPKLSLSAQGPATSINTFASDFERERDDLEDDLAGFRLWPVVSAGFVYQF